MPACGVPTRRSETCWNRATWRKACARRPSVGDDTIQKRTQGYTVPDAFTHGKAEQRVKWFRTGFASGDPRSCNTFAAKDL